MNNEDIIVTTFTEDRKGQHVGTAEQCVKLTHIPTGVTAWGYGHRNQHMNREMAMELLRQKVKELSVE